MASILMLATPVSGIPASRVAAAASRAWLDQRPHDEVMIQTISDGAPVWDWAASVGALRFEQSRNVSEALSTAGRELPVFATAAGDTLVLDYTREDDPSQIGVPGLSDVSSEDIATDLERARTGSFSRVAIVLPSPGRVTDGGRGLLSRLAGVQLDVPESGSGDAGGEESSLSPLAHAIRVARQRLTSEFPAMSVMTPRTQSLLGADGVAQNWIAAGLDPRTAQVRETELSAWAWDIADVAQAAALADEFTGEDRRYHAAGETQRLRVMHHPAAGALGGVGYVLLSLDVQPQDFGDFVFEKPDTRPSDRNDLVVYITGVLPAETPSTLVRASGLARDAAVPIVVVHGGEPMRRGDIPSMGLSGAYAYSRLDVSQLEATVTHAARIWALD
ncbi:MAG: hypothetical protein SPI12_04335 [Actinomycetaceae bacterium]|nr:hypothetical protein [Actinomycetaceae bacterium]MDY6083072.1 hypothetical protein [Actinomycetaceae bacterium]